VGQSISFSATVSLSAATGTVQFLDGTTFLANATVSGGVATLGMSSLAAGNHTITMNYGGDPNYLGSSATFVQSVKTTSATSLSANPAAVSFGQPVQLTASVAPASATGTVQFLDGSTLLGTVAVSGGTAVLANSTLAVGSHTITAVYSGDGNNLAGTSAAVTVIVSKATSSIAVTTSLNPSVSGQAVSFMATVAPNAATGTVQFLDGTSALGTVAINGGVATIVTSSLAAGSHTISASYSGDGNFTSASAALTQAVMATTVTTLSTSGRSIALGEAIQLTASIAPASATGTVQFLDGSSAIGTVTLSGGVATLSVPGLAVGSHTLAAVYSGDGNDVASTSATVIVTVSKIGSSLALTSSANPALAGQPVTFTATLSPLGATGTVQFLDGTTLLGTVPVVGGSASLVVPALGAETHSVTAVYSGDSNYGTATSPVLAETVNKTAVSVGLTSSPNPAVLGTAVTFTATVTPSAATGTVQFLDGTTALGLASVTAGAATLATSALAVGSHSITAVYGGDALDSAGGSSALTEIVKAPLPDAPSGLIAVAASYGEIKLSWVASPTSGVTYSVYSSTTSGFTPAASNRIAAGVTATTYTQTGLAPVTTHFYVVTTQNTVGESAKSNQASATTQSNCHVTYSVTTQWDVGFGAAITIQNTGTTPVNGWSLTWKWAQDQTITESWDSSYSQTGVDAKLTNLSWNPAIAAGATLTGVGFNASYSGKNSVPGAFYLNGTLCQ
jgi:hypothetical protein